MLGKLSFTAAVMDDARREKAETRKFPIDIERAVSCEGNGSAHAPAAATAQCLPPYVTSTRVKVMRTQLRQTPMNKSDHNGYWAALERSKLVRLGVRNRSQ